jgi:hypothetical protein
VRAERETFSEESELTFSCLPIALPLFDFLLQQESDEARERNPTIDGHVPDFPQQAGGQGHGYVLLFHEISGVHCFSVTRIP